MSKSYKALIKYELLVWARKSARMEIEEASHRLGITEEELRSWEDGSERPTIVQLRKASAVYQQSFGAFFLPKPPQIFPIPVRDYRMFPDEFSVGISSDLALDLRLSMDRREMCLELYGERKETPPAFGLLTSLRSDPEEVATTIRKVLGVSSEEQKEWEDPRVALNIWREKLENTGVLVFQSVDVPLSEMRGYSVILAPLPVIVVNRKDAYAGRVFSMMHELGHLMLRSSGLCNLEVDASEQTPKARTEVFCNHLAGSVLVPAEHLLEHPVVRRGTPPEWENDDLRTLAKAFSVSREVVLRRLLILGLTTEEFYQAKRRDYLSEPRRPQKGFVPPSTDIVSSAGKVFSRLVLDAYNTGRINASDASELFGVRVKHFDLISQAVATG